MSWIWWQKSSELSVKKRNKNKVHTPAKDKEIIFNWSLIVLSVCPDPFRRSYPINCNYLQLIYLTAQSIGCVLIKIEVKATRIHIGTLLPWLYSFEINNPSPSGLLVLNLMIFPRTNSSKSIIDSERAKERNQVHSIRNKLIMEWGLRVWWMASIGHAISMDVLYMCSGRPEGKCT